MTRKMSQTLGDEGTFKGGKRGHNFFLLCLALNEVNE